MWWLSDAYIFPTVQAALFLCFIFVCVKDANLQRPGAVSRAAESMQMLGVTAGFGATVVTLINGSALKEDLWLKNYSVIFNVVDIVIILYLCLKSPIGRNWIIGRHIDARKE